MSTLPEEETEIIEAGLLPTTWRVANSSSDTIDKVDGESLERTTGLVLEIINSYK